MSFDGTVFVDDTVSLLVYVVSPKDAVSLYDAASPNNTVSFHVQYVCMCGHHI